MKAKFFLTVSVIVDVWIVPSLVFCPFQQGRGMSKDLLTEQCCWIILPVSMKAVSSGGCICIWKAQFGVILGQNLAEHESCGEEVVFPGHEVWGVLLSCIKNLDFCGCTAWVATLLMQVWGLGDFEALAENGFCSYKIYWGSRQNKLRWIKHSWAGVHLQLGSFCHSFIALSLVFKKRFS